MVLLLKFHKHIYYYHLFMFLYLHTPSLLKLQIVILFLYTKSLIVALQMVYQHFRWSYDIDKFVCFYMLVSIDVP